MKFRLLTFILLSAFSILMFTSCDKDTEVITKTDTVYIRSIDTVFKMNAASWKAFSYQTLTIIDSGATSFFTTTDGVKMVGQGFRLGIRLQTLSEVGFVNKSVYWKWKVAGNGLFAAVVPQLKWDPTTGDGSTPNPGQGIDFDIFHVNGTLAGSTLVTENTWYYTRMTPVAGTDNYQIVTSTTNYNNQGGTVISTKTIPIYTKSGYIAIRLADNYGSTNANLILGECKINKN
jgi:hypothetical protein